jgi:hypothetical protein
MNPPVITSIAHADPNAAPLTLNDLIDILNPLLSSIIQGSYVPYIKSQSTPTVDDQDKAWIELDIAGRPVALKTFVAGNWRRVYNGMIGEIRGYTGNPSVDFDPEGKGLIGGTYDGWQICNGKNGSPDLSDKFMCSGHMNNTAGHSGYSSGWQTFIDGITDRKSGGSKDHMLQMADLPPLDPTTGHSELRLHGKGFKADIDHPGFPAAIVDTNYGNLQNFDVPIANYGANPNGSPPTPQTAVPLIPPFFVAALIIFQGY